MSRLTAWGDVAGLRAGAAAAAASWSVACDGTVLDRPWEYAPGELDALVEELLARVEAGEAPAGWFDDPVDASDLADGIPTAPIPSAAATATATATVPPAPVLAGVETWPGLVELLERVGISLTGVEAGSFLEQRLPVGAQGSGFTGTVGERLLMAVPQAEQVRGLAGLDPARPEVPLDGLVEMVVAAGRVAAWAQAVQARAAAAVVAREVAHHRAQQDAARSGHGPGSGYRDETMAERAMFAEVACAAGVSREQVERWVGVAESLARVPGAGADLQSGELSWSKAAAFQLCASGFDPAIADRVYARFRGQVGRWTVGVLRSRWERAFAEADPATSQEHTERAHAERDIHVAKDRGTGLAGLHIIGTATDIYAAAARIDDLAAAVRAADPADPRDLGAIRSDLALDLLRSGWTLPTGPFGSERPGAGDSVKGADRATAATTGVGDTGGVGRPGRRGGGGRHQVIVTVPLSVLTGASQAPAVMAGYGPIPAQLAREIAADATWRCAVVDDDPASPTHRALLAVGHSTFTPTYLPGPGLRRFLTIRDGTCRFPGCRVPAHRCDADHRIPHARGGPTCEDNLQSLCGYHHRLKHEGGVTVRPDLGVGTDALVWTMPSGRTYTTEPEPPPF